MKGILKKTQSGWIVIYDQVLGEGIVKKNQNALPLHPEYQTILPLDLDLEGKEVEFEISMYDGKSHISNAWNGYAKLIHHSVEPNEMIDHIGDANEMVENYNQIIGKPLEDYVREKHSQDRCMGFIDGYNKAKETLYTKQDVIDSVVRMYDIFMDNTLEAKMLRLKGISWHIQNTLESLKQPKQ